jgi:hypothetical protein
MQNLLHLSPLNSLPLSIFPDAIQGRKGEEGEASGQKEEAEAHAGGQARKT